MLGEILLENMPVKEKQRVASLVLGRGRNLAVHHQICKVVFNVRLSQFYGGLVVQIALKVSPPVRVGLECFSGIVAGVDLSREFVNNCVTFGRSRFLETTPVTKMTSRHGSSMRTR